MTDHLLLARVLVVDDDLVDRRAVRRALEGRYVVIEAENVEQALRSLEADEPACVLLDYNIPGTNTLTLLDQLRQRAPVIMLTGQGDETIAVAAMKAGARDYLSKHDFSPEALVVAVERSIRKMDRQRQQSAARNRLRDEYLQEKERRLDLEASLQVAHDIQQNLIPSNPPDVDGFEFCGVYLPAEQTGGDFFDYVPMSDGAIAVVVVDVAGHGIGPALLAAETRACIRALVRMTADVGQIATMVNKLLAHDMPGGCFATLFLAKFDPAAHTLTYAAAGHCAYIVSKSGESMTLQSQALPLGVDEGFQFLASNPIGLQPGDILLIATDGLFETRSPENMMLGSPRCVQLVYHHRREPAEKIVDELLHAMHTFAENIPPNDDVTIVVTKVR